MKITKRTITCDICNNEFGINGHGCRVRFWKREYSSLSGDCHEFDLCPDSYQRIFKRCKKQDNNEKHISYYENVMDFLYSQLNDDRYSSVCFDLLTILISGLFRCGYVCSFDDDKLIWRITK